MRVGKRKGPSPVSQLPFPGPTRVGQGRRGSSAWHPLQGGGSAPGGETDWSALRCESSARSLFHGLQQTVFQRTAGALCQGTAAPHRPGAQGQRRRCNPPRRALRGRCTGPAGPAARPSLAAGLRPRRGRGPEAQRGPPHRTPALHGTVAGKAKRLPDLCGERCGAATTPAAPGLSWRGSPGNPQNGNRHRYRGTPHPAAPSGQNGRTRGPTAAPLPLPVPALRRQRQPRSRLAPPQGTQSGAVLPGLR